MWRDFKGDLDVERNSFAHSGRNCLSVSPDQCSNYEPDEASDSGETFDYTEQQSTSLNNHGTNNEIRTNLSNQITQITDIDANMASSVFDINAAADRQIPELPTTDGVEYPRAASWASESLANILKDEKGSQLFRVFLHDALAEENLSFLESFQRFKKMTDVGQKRQYIEEFFSQYSPYVNLSSVAMQKIKEAAASENPEPSSFALAVKEVTRMLENDQFPRFKRSEIYLKYLEKLLPRAYAERWSTSFEALLGNQIGRHYFRIFLRNVHAEENLRFWEAVIEFKQTSNRSPAMQNMGRNIQKQYLVDGAHNEVFLPFGIRQVIDKRISDKEVDSTLFDDAIRHVEQVLKNDPYVRFLQSKEYSDLLDKLN